MRWAIGLAAATWMLIGVVIVSVRGQVEPASPVSLEVAGLAADGELKRCRDLGERASDDPSCRATWAAARAHFFGKARP